MLTYALTGVKIVFIAAWYELVRLYYRLWGQPKHNAEASIWSKDTTWQSNTEDLGIENSQRYVENSEETVVSVKTNAVQF